jgi:hypothetical protein
MCQFEKATEEALDVVERRNRTAIFGEIKTHWSGAREIRKFRSNNA